MGAKLVLCFYNSIFYQGEDLASKINLSLAVASAAFCSKTVVPLLFIFFVYCCSHCLLGFVFGPCFVIQYFVAIISLWKRELVLYFNCLLAVMWLFKIVLCLFLTGIFWPYSLFWGVLKRTLFYSVNFFC